MVLWVALVIATQKNMNSLNIYGDDSKVLIDGIMGTHRLLFTYTITYISIYIGKVRQRLIASPRPA